MALLLSLSYCLAVASAAAAAAAAPSHSSCGRNVTFFGPWPGGAAWLVNYTGPVSNDRPPHVQVGRDPDVKAGQFACLTNLRAATKSAIEWDVVGVVNKAGGKDAVAHFTVYFGPDAEDHVDEFR
jgi:hypothetical protein